MAHFSLSPKFIKESILLFKSKSLKEIFLGKRVSLGGTSEKLLHSLHQDFTPYDTKGGRSGRLQRADALHRGSGQVFLIPNELGDPTKETLVVLSEDTLITSGPDLYLYLSEHKTTKQPDGSFLNLGDLQGTKGSQAYVVKQPIRELDRYKYALVYCRQFSVVFSPAELSKSGS